MEAERLPRGADPARHTKLGPGGLADVEWTVQLLQLRTPRGARAAHHATLRALDGGARRRAARRRAGRDPARTPGARPSRVRNAVLLVRGRRATACPTDLRELSGVARLLGYPPGASGSWSTTTVARRGGRGRWWRRCSTGERDGRRDWRTRYVVRPTATSCAPASSAASSSPRSPASWGDHVARVALASLVLARTDSAFLAVLAFVVSFVPAVFGSALLGALADRLPRKVVMLAATWRALVVHRPSRAARRRRDAGVGAAGAAARRRVRSRRRSRPRTAPWSPTCCPTRASAWPASG